MYWLTLFFSFFFFRSGINWQNYQLSHFIFKRQMFYYKALYSLKLSRLNLLWATLTPNKTFQLLSRYLTSVLTSFRCGALALPAKDLYHFHSETFTKNLRQVLTSPCNGKIEKKDWINLNALFLNLFCHYECYKTIIIIIFLQIK